MNIEQALEPCLIHKAVFVKVGVPPAARVSKRGRFISEKERIGIRNDIKSGNYTLGEIAKRWERSVPTIRSYVMPEDVLPKGYPRKIPLEAHSNICERRASGETVVSIAADFNVSIDAIQAILRAKK